MKNVFYHGGPAGRDRFSFLLPPSITRVQSTTDLVGQNSVYRNDRVYLTSVFAGALMYAAGFKNGVIYRCEPIGDIEDDPDCDVAGMSIQCQRARVLSIIKPNAADLESVRAMLLRGEA